MVQLLRDTVSGNVDTFFAAIRHGIPVTQVEPPTAALEYARRLAQREISADALVRAYRLGHRAALEAILSEIRTSNIEPRLSLNVFERMATTSFDYIDWISAAGHRHLPRGARALGREPKQPAYVAGSRAPRWWRCRHRCNDHGDPLSAQRNPPAPSWCGAPKSDDGAEPAALEPSVRKLAESVGGQDNSLFISVDRATGWGWIPLSAAAAAKAAARLRKLATATSGPCIAAGNPLPGVDGFRRSHQQAQDARNVAMAAGAGTRRRHPSE